MKKALDILSTTFLVTMVVNLFLLITYKIGGLVWLVVLLKEAR